MNNCWMYALVSEIFFQFRGQQHEPISNDYDSKPTTRLSEQYERSCLVTMLPMGSEEVKLQKCC